MPLSVAGSKRIEAVLGAMSPFLNFFQDPVVTARMGDPAVSDFVAGNPQEMPLPEFSAGVTALEHPAQQGLVRLQDERARPAGALWLTRCANDSPCPSTPRTSL